MTKIKNIEKFQYITNQWSSIGIEEQVELACSAGCKWIQLRVKELSYEEWKSIAFTIKSICKKFGATFIINDNVQLALELEADGVHLGQNDMLPKDARIILGDHAIIGGTANQFDQIYNLHNQKVDYVGLGPYRFTKTKKNLAPVLGLNGYYDIVTNCKAHEINIPIIGIGGINPENIPEILSAGIFGIAVSSIISNSDSPQKITDTILKTIKSHKHGTIKNS